MRLDDFEGVGYSGNTMLLL